MLRILAANFIDCSIHPHLIQKVSITFVLSPNLLSKRKILRKILCVPFENSYVHNASILFT